jgi:GTP-binding protein
MKNSKLFTVAFVGRPNVGKSTFFNRLAKKQLAIVDDTPGVTRDWREAEGYLFDKIIRIIDTAGLEESFDDSIQGRMRKQTEAGLALADVVVFMIDGRAGLTPLDEHFADWLRRRDVPVILCLNKAENDKAVQTAKAESYALGLGDPVCVSAAHGDGLGDFYNALLPFMPEEGADSEDDDAVSDLEEDLEALDEIEGDEDYEFVAGDQEEIEDETKPIKIAIVGRPNVGKSTLLNAIVNDERVMTGPEAGITRDAVTVDWDFEGRAFKLVDTAGMRRTSKVQDKIEKMSVFDSMRAIRLAQVVVLVLDGHDMLEKQDLQIAEHVINEGRALVLAVNKWDEITDRQDRREELEYKLGKSLAQLKDVPYVTTSAINKSNIERLLRTVVGTYGQWNIRVKTAGLNRWLGRMESQNPAPMVEGRSNRLKYITQIKTRPPTFAMWVSRAQSLPQSHRRFIVNGLRRDFGIEGVPVRLLVRESKNPFMDKK